jgi:hypothetical protein
MFSSLHMFRKIQWESIPPLRVGLYNTPVLCVSLAVYRSPRFIE